MQISTLDLSKLTSAQRWKVELHISQATDDYKFSNFPAVNLSELFDERKGSINPQEETNTEITYIGLENVESVTGDLVGEVRKYLHEIKSRSKTFQEGDILYGKLRPTLNKVFYNNQLPIKGICSGEFLVLIPKQEVIRGRILREILASHFVLENVSRFIAGAALPRISANDLRSIKVPLPDMETQLRLEAYLIEQDQIRKEANDLLINQPYEIAERLKKDLQFNY